MTTVATTKDTATKDAASAVAGVISADTEPVLNGLVNGMRTARAAEALQLELARTDLATQVRHVEAAARSKLYNDILNGDVMILGTRLDGLPSYLASEIEQHLNTLRG